MFIFPFRGSGLFVMIVISLLLAAVVWGMQLITELLAHPFGFAILGLPMSILGIVAVVIDLVLIGYTCKHLLSVASSSAAGCNGLPAFRDVESGKRFASLLKFIATFALALV